MGVNHSISSLLAGMFEILRKYITTRKGGGRGCGIVVLDDRGGGGDVPVVQLHDKILCTTCKDIALMLVLPLAGRLKYIILFRN
jgi:hypothetical protein